MLHVPTALPYRGDFGAPRPAALDGLALPPGPMPPRVGARPLKAWRYVGVFCEELMVCLASVRIGPVRQSFWAVWDRGGERLYERTRLGAGRVTLVPGRVQISDGPIALDLVLTEGSGVETISPSGPAYGWTRKQGGIPAAGTIAIEGRTQPVDARAIVDDTAAYYERHTRWRWSAGVGETASGRAVAWNLVDGVHDAPVASERTIWLDGLPSELPPAAFAADLSAVGGLRFTAEATREHAQNLIVLRSAYRQPFGTFSGRLTPEVTVAHGLGVMESHDVSW